MYFRKIVYFLKSQSNSAFLVRGSALSLLLRIASAGIVFTLHVILARLLAIKDYGYYAYASSWIALLVYLSKLGTDTSIVKFVPDYHTNEHWGMIKGLLMRSRQLILGLSLCIISMAVLIIYFNRDAIGREQSTALLIALGSIPLFGLMSLYTVMLRAFRHVFKTLSPSGIIWPLTLIALVMVYSQVRDHPLNVSEAMGLNLAALFVAVWISRYWFIKGLPVNVKQAAPEFCEWQWLKISFPLFLITGFHIILSKTDTIMIGVFSDEQQVALYSVASRTGELILFGVGAAEVIVAPLIARLYAQKDMVEIQKIVTITTWGISLFALSAIVFLIMFGKHILSLFGESFVESYTPLLILIVGYGIKAFAGTAMPLMMMTRYQKQITLITGLSAGLNILLNLFLIPRYAAIGAAIATMTTMAFSYLVMLIYIIKKLKINPTPFARLTPL